MKRFALLLLLALGAQVHAESRPILQASWQGIEDYGTSPLHWTQDDAAWLIPTIMGTGILWNNDVYFHDLLSTGSARKTWLDQSMPTVSTLGEGWSELPLVLLGYWLGDERFTRTSGVALQSLAVAAVYTEVFKEAAWSNRPSQDAKEHRLWAYDQASKGMPSGHTFAAFALAEAYGSEYGRVLPYSLAAIMGYSRIYNEAHWSSDVFVGAILGIAAGHLSHKAANEKGAPALRWSLQQRGNAQVLMAQWAY